jgi:hypothetical protein
VAWRQGLEFVGDVSGQDNQQRGIAAQREMLAQQIEKITVGPVTKPGSHTFDPSTVTITWRTPVGGERPAAPARLVGPRIQLEIRGRPSPQPAGERDA